jgi:hypothetical protein
MEPSSPRSVLKRIFLSPDEPRLRAGWRLLIQIILLFVVSNCLAFPLIAAWAMAQEGGIFLNVEQILNQPIFLLLNQLITLVAVTLSVFLARRFLDRRSFASLGLQIGPHTWRDLFAGFLISFGIMAFIYGLEWYAGWLKLAALSWQIRPPVQVAGDVVLTFLLFLMVAWTEELLSRGYHLQTIASGLNLFWGVTLSSLIFGLLHLGNPHATWLSVGGILLAGMFLAYGYTQSGQLWLPMGLHLGWNFFEGTIFGFPVSGLEIPALLRNQFSGPELWTGGAFGPEAGLIVLPGLILGFWLIKGYTRLRK